MDAKKLRHHELIGLKVKIVECPDHTKIGRSGKVIDETRNLLVIFGEKKFRVPKKDCVFEFVVEDKKIRLKGSEIVGQPHKRLK